VKPLLIDAGFMTECLRKETGMRKHMRKQKIIKCLITFVSFLLVDVSMVLLPVYADANKSPETVKVGVLNNSSLAFRDEEGTWRGSDIECMLDIAQKAGFNVEFIDSSTDADLFEHIDDGTYDILTDMAKGESFRDDYLFTDESISTTTSTLAVRSDDSRWDYGNIDQLSQMKIGVIGLYETNKDFRTWCTKHAVTPKITEYQDFEEMTAALENGEIDGELYLGTDVVNDADKLHTILRFLPEDCFFMFRKSDVELKNKVDTALSQILSGNADYLVNLRNKYETQFSSNVLPLSSSEKTYISEHPILNVAVVSGDSPYYMREPDGTDSGIIPDYYKLISNWSGLHFQYKIFASSEEAVEAVKNGDADVIGLFTNGLISAYGNGLSQTDSISTAGCILLTDSGIDPSGIKSIAVVESTKDSLQTAVSRLYPDAEITGYKNAEECFSAVKRKETDATLLGVPSAEWIINQTNSIAYSMIPVSGATYDSCAAVKLDNQTLCSIINKSIAATKGSFTGIVTKDTLAQGDWMTVISRIPPVIIVLTVTVLLVLVIGLFWAMILLRRRQKERALVLKAQSEAEQQRLIAEEKNTFFSNISHDMRTPLNAVIGFAELGGNEKDDSKKNVYFDKIKSSGKLLNSLIDDTLTISKINSGKLKLNPEPTRPSELFETILDSIGEAAAKKNITFSVDDSGKKDRVVLADRLNLQKICLNLLSNAVKYTPEGGCVSVRIFNDPKDGENPDSVFEVSDNGIGISKDFQPHIFEPFSQERRSGYESVGTGLGLSIVKQLVDLMGGTIEVKSEKDKGSTFTVRLHLKEADSRNAEENKMIPVKTYHLKGKKVLLCEDNLLNSEIAAALLKSEGMETVRAENGSEGVKKYRDSAEREYDAVLMDIRMPVMDGYEAARLIRSSERDDAAAIPILAMTADAFPEDIQKCLDAGMNGHIAKPIDPQALFTELEKKINRQDFHF